MGFLATCVCVSFHFIASQYCQLYEKSGDRNGICQVCSLITHRGNHVYGLERHVYEGLDYAIDFWKGYVQGDVEA